MPGIPTVKAVLNDTPYLVTFTDDLGHAWCADEPAEIGGGNAAPTLSAWSWPVSAPAPRSR